MPRRAGTAVAEEVDADLVLATCWVPVPALVGRGNPAAVVAVCGRLDMFTAPLLRARLDELLPCPGLRVVLELNDVVAFDYLALSLLSATQQRVSACGGLLQVVASRPDVVKALRAVGLTELVSVHPDLDDALSAAAA